MMSTRKSLALVLALPFTVLSAYAVVKVGYLGVFGHLLDGPAGWQVFADLVVALALVCSWMIVDARKNGRSVWPYLIATLLLGSFGPLAYLLLGRADQVPQSAAG